MSRTQSILARDHLSILAGFALSNVLLAFDYDGTLAPITARPAEARMRPATRDLLVQAARRYPLVVISGRALDDVLRHLDEIPVWYVFGNHGMEPAGGSAARSSPVDQWVRHLKETLPDDPGLVIEDKKHSLTIHYRNARNRQAAIDAVQRAVGELPGAVVLGGKEAFNVLPQDGAHKGIALERATRQFACDHAIYVGDDETDESAFAAMPPDRLLSIRVGRVDTTHARYRLESQRHVDALMQALLDLRLASG